MILSGKKKNSKKQNIFKIERQLQDCQRDLFADLDTGPHVIPRPKHCISRKNIDKEALKVLYRLKDHGYLAYLVGGSVRDLLLGKRPKDFDIGTDATPEEVRRLFRTSRIIGKRFRLVHVYFRGGKRIEVSTFRKQIELDDREARREGLGPESIFGSPREDAFRRDLTINGLFYNISDFSVIDFVGGIEDLKAGVIRTIGDPDRRFIRDPVRMMRAIRHAARTGFKIHPVTWQAICRHAEKIRLCAIPRVRDEWLKDLKSGFSAIWLKYMLKSGLFREVFPGLQPFFERDPEVKRYLFGMMAQIDSLVRENGPQEYSEAFFIAALAYPLLHFSPKWQALKPVKVRWPTQEVRALVDDIYKPYDFRRADREMVVQLLAIQWPITICAEKGRWQKRVYSKPAFHEGILLYNAIQKLRRQPQVDVSSISFKGGRKKEGKKRGGRRKRQKSTQTQR